jgi:hypothetical protein
LTRYCAVVLLSLLACAAGCQRRISPSAAPAASATPVGVASATSVDGRLPEDPVAGARAVALWREHLIEEERERKAIYDRAHLKDHEVVLAFLRQTQGSYDNAKSKGAVLQLRRTLVPALSATRRRLDKIDHWGGSSNLIVDYQRLLDAFAESYPEARIAALQGDAKALSALQAEAGSRLQKISDWLAFVAKTEAESDPD